MKIKHVRTRRLLSLAGSSALCLAGAALAATSGCSSDDPPGPSGPDCSPGNICTVAGTDFAGYSGDGEAAVEAALYLPQDMTVGPDGRWYVADWNNHRIRVIDEDGVIETIAGTGLLGDGPEGPALDASFNHPTNIIFDDKGLMIIAAWHNSRIKTVDLATGELLDTCGTGGRSYKGDGGNAEDAVLDLPAGIALDDDGILYMNDQANQVIRRVLPDGTIERFAGMCVVNECAEGEEAQPCADSDKHFCGAETPDVCNAPCQPAYGGDGGLALEARFSAPFGQMADPAGRLAFDKDGSLYIADTGNSRIRKISPDGMIETVAGTGTPGYAGDGGPAVDAELNRPVDIAFDADGNLFVADTFNSCVRVIATDGTISTAAGVCGSRGFAGDGGVATEAELDRPYGIEVSDGELFIIDTYNHRIRRVILP